MPGFHEAVAGALRRHGLAVEHAGLAEREIADINHFLDFAFSLGNRLSGFHLNKNSQVMLVFSQQLAPALNHVAAARGWNIAPGFEGFIGSRDHLRCLLFGGALDFKKVLAGQWRAGLQVAAFQRTSVATRFQSILDGGKKLVVSLSSHRKWFLFTSC